MTEGLTDRFGVVASTGIAENEASIEEARNKAVKWFDDLLEMLKENMPELWDNHISGKENE